MIDTYSIICRFYEPGSELCNLLLKHSKQVAELALQLAKRLVDAHTPVDLDFVQVKKA